MSRMLRATFAGADVAERFSVTASTETWEAGNCNAGFWTLLTITDIGRQNSRLLGGVAETGSAGPRGSSTPMISIATTAIITLFIAYLREGDEGPGGAGPLGRT